MLTPDQKEEFLEQTVYDRYWLRQNIDVLARLAQDGFFTLGRGVVLVNLAELIIRRGMEEGHPFNYHTGAENWFKPEKFDDVLGGEVLHETTHILLEEYSPDREFLVMLVRPNRSKIYRTPLPKSQGLDLEIRGEQVELGAEERRNRLSCTDFWARPFPLVSPHTQEWLYRLA